MSLIEQAAKRLEELRRAGVSLPADATTSREHGGGKRVDHASERTRVEPRFRTTTSASTTRSAQQTVQILPERARFRCIDVDLEKMAAAGIITPGSPRSQVADEFRVIKRPLIANATGKGAAPIRNGNLIMVTSAVPGEGKSFTAANLAMSIAMELDHTVLLVDADVARPSLPRMFGMTPAPGLLDVLVETTSDLGQVLLRTNVEKLSILQSGTQHPRATELLASDAMASLLEEMATRYSDRIVIFDSPPLLVTTEARVLASHMGQIVVVVQAERTLHSDVKQALAAIDSCPVKLMTLNKARSAAKEGYGYGYGYGYGS
jgi:exopolysaccharide/PEP-CTERM locus tyrosine autokinase